MIYKLEEILKKIESALSLLFKNDKLLIDNNTNERTIAHKLATYLQNEFSDYNVDFEYNRDGDEIKKIGIPKYRSNSENIINWDDIQQKTVFPDIIIHKRKTKNNLVVIEVKKSTNKTDKEYDERKLKAFTQEPYNYEVGFFILIDIKNCNYCYEIFKEGKKIKL